MRKKFLVCILLPCCILIAACGHTADTKNDLLSENINLTPRQIPRHLTMKNTTTMDQQKNKWMKR